MRTHHERRHPERRLGPRWMETSPLKVEMVMRAAPPRQWVVRRWPTQGRVGHPPVSAYWPPAPALPHRLLCGSGAGRSPFAAITPHSPLPDAATWRRPLLPENREAFPIRARRHPALPPPPPPDRRACGYRVHTRDRRDRDIRVRTRADLQPLRPQRLPTPVETPRRLVMIV